MAENEKLKNLVSADVKGTVIRHYRVDKMQNIKILDEPRTGKEVFEGFDLALFSARIILWELF